VPPPFFATNTPMESEDRARHYHGRSNPGAPATQSCYFGASEDFTEKSRHSARKLVPTPSLAPTNSHFRAEKREFRRPVSVRNFPISVFAAAGVPETYLFSTETGSTVPFLPSQTNDSKVLSIMLFCLRALSQPSLASCEAEVLA